MAIYNYTFENVTGIADLVSINNAATDGLLFGGIILAVFFISLIILTFKSSFENGLMVSSWSAFLLSLIASFMGEFNFYFVLVFLILASLSILYAYIVRK